MVRDRRSFVGDAIDVCDLVQFVRGPAARSLFLPRRKDYKSPPKDYWKILRTRNGDTPITADVRAMRTNALSKATKEVRSYAQLQRQIHDALRVEHPEWVEPNGDCPTCESYESRLAELLGLSSSNSHQAAA